MNPEIIHEGNATRIALSLDTRKGQFVAQEMDAMSTVRSAVRAHHIGDHTLHDLFTLKVAMPMYEDALKRLTDDTRTYLPPEQLVVALRQLLDDTMTALLYTDPDDGVSWQRQELRREMLQIIVESSHSFPVEPDDPGEPPAFSWEGATVSARRPTVSAQDTNQEASAP